MSSIKKLTVSICFIMGLFLLINMNCFASCSDSEGNCEDVSYMTPEQGRAAEAKELAIKKANLNNSQRSSRNHLPEVLVTGVIAIFGVGLYVYLKKREK
ncbi:MAG: hypothetical protein M9962_13910 [Oligoflexia bacterium]|nr:hypothetical protein [Oligoflexia bacterium]